MANIRINALPSEATPVKTDVLAIDGATTRKTTIEAAVLAGRPAASQAEAETGTDPTKAMVPLTTKQAIAAQGAVLFATAAQGAKADTAVQPALTISAGAGLTGGGTLAANRTLALSSASIASLALADSAVQPAAMTAYAAPIARAVPVGGTTSQVLVKLSNADNDVGWTAAGAGNVIGPATSVTSNFPAFADATGKVLKDSGVPMARLVSGYALKRIYLAPTGSYTPAADVRAIWVRQVGAGGGGGGAGYPGGQGNIGSGGGGGAYGEVWVAAPFAAPYAIVNGAGGAGGVGPSNGGSGGASSFGSLLALNGGGGGNWNAAASGSTLTAAGSGGSVATGGSRSSWGDNGGTGVRIDTASRMSGRGGGSPFGNGGGEMRSIDASTSFAGDAGRGFGAGGSGSISGSASNNTTGGAGANGYTEIWEFI